MPNTNTLEINVRDRKTLNRIKTVQSSSNILRDFFDKGFKTFDALKSIVMHYYPEMPELKLYDFWHFRRVDSEMCEALENVFEKLKSE
ncbi:hypothetical protein [Flavobacterium sp. UGB4466]|uniref:hypothetical protein n=1 Tax=Flavobacterium sp. UGB4466 TaxID=2730889 RepID=UPI00192C443E|nr:hypothetical protein [Flavobacterium sp. UGB4466]